MQVRLKKSDEKPSQQKAEKVEGVKLPNLRETKIKDIFRPIPELLAKAFRSIFSRNQPSEEEKGVHAITS